MERTRWGVLVLVLALTASGARGAAPAVEDAVKVLAERIDSRIEAGLKANKVPAAPPAADPVFLRRVYLDVAGRIPSVAEARSFLEERRPNRRRLVERLLKDPAYANHFSTVWRVTFVPQSLTNTELQYVSLRMETWLRNRVASNVGYDRLVRELLTTPLPYQLSAAPEDPEGPPAVAFYQANELKVETLAGSAARLFMGIQLQCAECHNHPFADWKREQFWETAAFFAGVPPRPIPRGLDKTRRNDEPTSLRLPGTNKTVMARFLDGKLPKTSLRNRPRQAFAEWLTAADNPYFARVAVNRIWAQFFGIGLVEPLDDFGEHNPPSHPQLLDDLAREFSKHGCDVKFLIRAITSSRTYQRSSASTHRGQTDPRRFARRHVKGLSAEQIFDSLAQATGYQETIPRAHRPLFGAPAGSPRGEFLKKFAGSGQRTDMQTSILQALTLMNGKFISKLTDPDQGKLLTAVVNAPFLDKDGKLEALYLATLSRPPRPEERRRLMSHLERRGSRKGLADVFWVLLNSPEFLLNH